MVRIFLIRDALIPPYALERKQRIGNKMKEKQVTMIQKVHNVGGRGEEEIRIFHVRSWKLSILDKTNASVLILGK